LKAIALLAFYLFLLALVFIGVQADLIFNPWLRDVQNFQWWNYFTSGHALTILWLQGYWWTIFIIPAVLTLLLAIWGD